VPPVIPDGYALRPLAIEHAPALAAAYTRNREHLAPWEPRRSEAFYTEAGQREHVADHLGRTAAGQMALWVVEHGDEVVGRIALNNIVHGVFNSGQLGYWVDAGHLRRGLATGLVTHACEQALELGLHRVEAGTMLANEASQRVLLGCGFVRYGLAEEMLFLAGAWQDHLLFQRILHDRPL